MKFVSEPFADVEAFVEECFGFLGAAAVATDELAECVKHLGLVKFVSEPFADVDALAEECFGFLGAAAVATDELAECVKHLSSVMVDGEPFTDRNAPPQLGLRGRRSALSGLKSAHDVQGDSDLDAITFCLVHRP